MRTTAGGTSPHARGSGNCAVFAASYQEVARQHGIAGEVRTCLLIDGQGHAYFKTANGVLDVRQVGVEDELAVGCLPSSVRVVGGAVAFR